jgi:hypothetical protein
MSVEKLTWSYTAAMFAALIVTSGRTLIIVSRERLDIWGVVRRSGGPNLEVRLDQRLGERRARFTRPDNERRQGERRRRDVSAELARLGWAIVRADDRAL